MQLKTVPEDFVVVEQAKHVTKESGDYLLVELTKRNMSTEKAIAELGEALKLQRKAFGYAGTKDSRALTRQHITIKASPDLAERVKKVNRNGIALRVLGYTDDPLSLGMLERNRFEIVVRKIDAERIMPASRIPNYFDEQRFSSANAQVGKLIVKADFKAAAELIVKTDNEVGSRIAEWLSEHPNDAVSALKFVPRNILLMFVHSYQSSLFNEVLSEYIMQHDPAAVRVEGPVQFAAPSKELPDVEIPLFGFGTERDPMFGELYERILEREGVAPRDFVIRSMPFLTLEGDERSAFFTISDLEVGQLEDDDMHPGMRKQKLSFVLPKGCYATMVVKVLYRAGRVLGDR